MRTMIALSGLLVAATLAAACGEDEALGIDGTGGSSAGTAGASGTAGSSGGSAGTGGGGGSGGAGGSNGGSGGAGGSSAAAGQAGDAGADAGACLPAGAEYKLDFCQTIDQPITKTTQIVPPYFGKLHADCRVAKLVDEHPALFEFGNDLTTFTLALWGCEAIGVTTFGLIDIVTEISAADAALLIEYYVDLTAVTLSLAPSQIAELENALRCLSQGVVTNPSTTEYTLSSCVPDGGADAASDASDAAIADGGGE